MGGFGAEPQPLSLAATTLLAFKFVDQLRPNEIDRFLCAFAAQSAFGSRFPYIKSPNLRLDFCVEYHY